RQQGHLVRGLHPPAGHGRVGRARRRAEAGDRCPRPAPVRRRASGPDLLQHHEGGAAGREGHAAAGQHPGGPRPQAPRQRSGPSPAAAARERRRSTHRADHARPPRHDTDHARADRHRADGPVTGDADEPTPSHHDDEAAAFHDDDRPDPHRPRRPGGEEAL
ncbi:MAG: Multimodular transpeptidase-transglycosylase, partial [uncultured Acidimicrobiales bacterium]